VPTAFRDEDLVRAGSHNYTVIGRLKPGVSVAQASDQMNRVAAASLRRRISRRSSVTNADPCPRRRPGLSRSDCAYQTSTSRAESRIREPAGPAIRPTRGQGPRLQPDAGSGVAGLGRRVPVGPRGLVFVGDSWECVHRWPLEPAPGALEARGPRSFPQMGSGPFTMNGASGRTTSGINGRGSRNG
jgi:hypothetical protein